MHAWDHDQTTRFLEAAKTDRLHILYVLAVASGMRQGELFALDWSDVDFKASAVSLRRTLEEIRGKLRLKEPKTAQSRRRIELPKFALDALHDHRKQMLAEGFAGASVFCDTDGGYLRKSNFAKRSFKPLMERTGYN